MWNQWEARFNILRKTLQNLNINIMFYGQRMEVAFFFWEAEQGHRMNECGGRQKCATSRNWVMWFGCKICLRKTFKWGRSTSIGLISCWSHWARAYWLSSILFGTKQFVLCWFICWQTIQLLWAGETIPEIWNHSSGTYFCHFCEHFKLKIVCNNRFRVL